MRLVRPSPMNTALHLVPISALVAARRIEIRQRAPAAPPTRWVPVRMGASWRLRRNSPRREGWASEYFYGGNRQPLALRECDARALARALNRSHPDVKDEAANAPEAA